MPRSIFTTATRIIWRDNCLAKQPRMRLGTWGKKLSAEYRMYRLWERNKMYAIIGTRCLYIYVCVCESVYQGFERELMVFEETLIAWLGGNVGKWNCMKICSLHACLISPLIPDGKKISLQYRSRQRECNRDWFGSWQLAKLNSRDRKLDAPLID